MVSPALPRRTQLREGMVAEVVIRGSRDASVPTEILRDGQLIGTRTAELLDGVARVRFADRLATTGAHIYRLRILPETDSAFLSGSCVTFFSLGKQLDSRQINVADFLQIIAQHREAVNPKNRTDVAWSRVLETIFAHRHS